MNLFRRRLAVLLAVHLAAYLVLEGIDTLHGAEAESNNGLAVVESATEAAAAVNDPRRRLFENEIRPALVDNCYECHSGENLEGGLDVTHRAGLIRGGDSGPAVVAGKPQESLLLAAIKYDGELKMPPDHKLPASLVGQFSKWIEQGAVDPREPEIVRSTTDLGSTQSSDSIDWQNAREFWAFQPVGQHPVPMVNDPRWPKSRHDYFVLRRIEQLSLTPSPAADDGTLAQRLSVDIIGLPLNSKQRARLRDNTLTHDALVAELLASPHFGERWARVWMDLARYAEDQAHIVGNNESLFYPNAYLYRDWVINAFNRDLPYDRFVRLQLAADLIPNEEANLAALGFLGLGPKYYDRGRLAVKAEEWEDRVDTVTRTFLGLTVACARCHDHKYDPLPTEDYYALASVFASTEMFNQPLNDDVEKKANGHAKTPSDALHIVRDGDPTDLPVFIRGNVQSKGIQTHRGFLTILGQTARQQFSDGSGRLPLANAIADPQNPLTARVFVNRIWGQLIGAPLVNTPSNFGNLGSRPSHPKLLDDLSHRFIRNGWSLKWLIREIVTSATYRQMSSASADRLAKDPDNTWLTRMHRKRLTAEAWRDRLLAACGTLDPAIGGPSFAPDQPQSVRRTVYSKISRFRLNPMLSALDVPDPNVHSAARIATTTPQQRLLALNHPFVIHQARALARQLDLDDQGENHPTQDADFVVREVHRRIFAREPTNDELVLARGFLAEHEIGSEENQNSNLISHKRLTTLVHTLLVTNEFLFLD